MTNKINDGGPAFPKAVRKQENYMDEGGYGRTRTVTIGSDGMSLRDWFAGQALAGLMSITEHLGETPIAEMAYNQADAMLKAREK